MSLPGDMLKLVRTPRALLERRLEAPAAASVLFLSVVTPLASLRPLAVLVRSVLTGTPLVGFVLGIGAFALQVGTWLGIALVIPTLARQFKCEIDERTSFTLTTFALMPLWTAGILYVVPEEPALIFWWSRLVVAAVACYGVLITYRGVQTLKIHRRVRMPLVAAIAGTGAVIYGLLFLLLGISSFVALFILG